MCDTAVRAWGVALIKAQSICDLATEFACRENGNLPIITINNNSDPRSLEHQVYAFGEQAGGMFRKKRQHCRQNLRNPLSERFLPLLEARRRSETGFFSSPK